MLATIPEITSDEVQSLLGKLAAQGNKIPAPKEVDVAAGEDHDGDPAFFLTVVFAKKEDPTKLPLKKLRPFVEELRNRVFVRGGADRPVIAKVVRLGEEPAR